MKHESILKAILKLNGQLESKQNGDTFNGSLCTGLWTFTLNERVLQWHSYTDGKACHLWAYTESSKSAWEADPHSAYRDDYYGWYPETIKSLIKWLEGNP